MSVATPEVPSAPWSAQQAPTVGPPRAIGEYAAGCVQGAVRLDPEGRGYQLLRLGRRRFFGHPDLVGYVRRLAEEVDRKRLGPLLVGDLAQARGGPTPTGHRSHQSGLDVDIWYARPKKRLGRLARERFTPPAVVDLRTRALTSAWRARTAEILALAAADPTVDRIFVHPVIKRELCARSPGASWQPKLRAWWGHHHHFHVRLKCPNGSDGCLPQGPLGTDDGCGDSLAWWFSDEARVAQEKRRETEPAPLPAACQRLLESP